MPRGLPGCPVLRDLLASGVAEVLDTEWGGDRHGWACWKGSLGQNMKAINVSSQGVCILILEENRNKT